MVRRNRAPCLHRSAIESQRERRLAREHSPAHHADTIMNNLTKYLLILCAVVFLFVSCSKRSSIIGKWQLQVDLQGQKLSEKEMAELETYRIKYEFFKEGTFTMSLLGTPNVGKYSFVEDDIIKIELGGMGSWAGPMLMRVSKSGKELSLTDPQGKVSTYERMK